MDLAIRVVAAADPVVPAIARLIALGMQYRVLDLERAFAHLPIAAEPLVLRVEVDDAFFPPTAGATTFRFGPAGPPSRANAAAPDATLRIGIADLSSLVVGSLALPPLLHHRLASVEPARTANSVAALFRADEPSTTATRF